MEIRIILTCLSLLALYVGVTWSARLKDNILIILPVILILLDGIDSIWTDRLAEKYKIKGLSYTFQYQSIDKVIDLASYAVSALLFHLPPFVPLFLLVRAIGVGLFVWTKNSVWLVAGVDFIKEYLAYSYFLREDTQFLGWTFLAKMAFEAVFHRGYLARKMAR